MSTTDFTQCEAWQRSMHLAESVYECTDVFPVTERFGVVAQLRNAAVSVASSIADGYCRYGYTEKGRAYCDARGSLVILMSLLHFVQRAGFLSQKKQKSLLRECAGVQKMLHGLIARMKELEHSPAVH